MAHSEKVAVFPACHWRFRPADNARKSGGFRARVLLRGNKSHRRQRNGKNRRRSGPAGLSRLSVVRPKKSGCTRPQQPGVARATRLVVHLGRPRNHFRHPHLHPTLWPNLARYSRVALRISFERSVSSTAHWRSIAPTKSRGIQTTICLAVLFVTLSGLNMVVVFIATKSTPGIDSVK